MLLLTLLFITSCSKDEKDNKEDPIAGTIQELIANSGDFPDIALTATESESEIRW